jgi:ribosomal protein S18 acetylase RimI-like enzyme
MVFQRLTEQLMALEWSDRLDDIDWDELSALYKIALGEKTAAGLRIVFTNSLYRCFVRDRGRMVGVGRALADGVDTSYICDVAVLPEYQGTGIGKQIVGKLVELSRGHKKILLYAVPGKEPFYGKFGFARMKTAMALFEDQQLAIARGYLET